MNLKNTLGILLILVITSSCKKLKEYEYVEDYEGSFNFTIYEAYINNHPTQGGEVFDTAQYYGTVEQLHRDEIIITYSSDLPKSTSCYDREYYYLNILNAYVDKSGKLTLPCTGEIEIYKFLGHFSSYDTLNINIKVGYGEYSTMEHTIIGVR